MKLSTHIESSRRMLTETVNRKDQSAVVLGITTIKKPFHIGHLSIIKTVIESTSNLSLPGYINIVCNKDDFYIQQLVTRLSEQFKDIKFGIVTDERDSLIKLMAEDMYPSIIIANTDTIGTMCTLNRQILSEYADCMFFNIHTKMFDEKIKTSVIQNDFVTFHANVADITLDESLALFKELGGHVNGR